MPKRKKTEFFLLRYTKLSEGEMFVTDYLKTKQRLERLEQDFEILKKFVQNQEIYFENEKKN